MTQQSTEPKPGDKMSDGTIYAGVSPDTGNPMYAMPADAPLMSTFNEAAENAQAANRSKALGHDDWRVPSKAELNVLFNNRAAVGGFDLSGSLSAGLYWSSSYAYHGTVWSQRFSDGFQVGIDGPRLSVRLVRTEATNSHLNKGAQP
jgi:hypothetical protein